jgi:hypothetical protein
MRKKCRDVGIGKFCCGGFRARSPGQCSQIATHIDTGTDIARNEAEDDMSFAIYLVGFVVFVAGVAWALVTAGLPHLYVAISVVILVGLGIISGVTRTRTKDTSAG